MNKKMDKLLKFMAIGCCTFAIALIIVLQQNNVKIQKHVKSADAIAESYTNTESNSWDISANEDGTITATLDEKGVLTISGTGEMKDWTHSVNAPWYSEKEQIKSVEIKNGITNIGNYAFYNCNDLINVEVPNSVTSIGDNAFIYCDSLLNIQIPSSVISIGFRAFFSCDNLVNIKIPDKLTSIGNSAFSWCSNLTSIEVEENNAVYKDNNGVLYSKDGKQIIKYPEGKKETEYNIPNGVTTITDEAFYLCNNLKDVKIPNSVTVIGDKAFSNCGNIEKIEIPEGVTSIGMMAFYNLYKLKNIEIPSSTTKIDDNAFSACHGLKSILIPSNVMFIGEEIIHKSTLAFPNAIIICQEGTIAQTYAENNNIEYISLNYDVKKGYIKNINVGTTYRTFKEHMNINIEGYIIEDEDEGIENDILLKTGVLLKICGIDFKMVVTGDTNKDGQAEIKDILAINKHRLNKSKLQAEELIAGDVNGDGTVDIKDIMQINKFRLGKINQL